MLYASCFHTSKFSRNINTYHFIRTIMRSINAFIDVVTIFAIDRVNKKFDFFLFENFKTLKIILNLKITILMNQIIFSPYPSPTKPSRQMHSAEVMSFSRTAQFAFGLHDFSSQGPPGGKQITVLLSSFHGYCQIGRKISKIEKNCMQKFF